MPEIKQAGPIDDSVLWGYDPSELQTTKQTQQEFKVPLVCQDYLPLEVQKQLEQRDLLR